MKKGSIGSSQIASTIILVCIDKECSLVKVACASPSNALSARMFREDLISCDGVPAGLFIQNILHALTSSGDSIDFQLLHLLERCKNVVQESILLLAAKSASFCDPRETIAESWFQVSAVVASSLVPPHELKTSLLVDTLVATFHLLLMSSMAKTQEERLRDPVMSLDGPQTLALISFLTAFLSQEQALVNHVLKLAAAHFAMESTAELNPEVVPFVILSSLLYRGCSGALPPWAIESMPELYSLFFDATGKNPDLFARLLRASMETTAATQLGAVAMGQPIAGPLFATMNAKTKDEFAVEALLVLNRTDGSQWRMLKAMIKRICGGKKKETDYGQKPPYTKWEFERV
jgi:hypothetical protein